MRVEDTVQSASALGEAEWHDTHSLLPLRRAMFVDPPRTDCSPTSESRREGLCNDVSELQT